VSEFLQIPVDRELNDRARWLISLRWSVLPVAVMVVLIANYWLGDVLPTGPLWATLLVIALYNGAFWIMARRLVRQGAPYSLHATLLHAQIVADLLALTVLLHFSGGLENPFATYYVLLVAIGSILMTAKAGRIYAALASALWVGLLMAEATGIIPHYNLAGFRLPIRYREMRHIVAESFVLVTANFAVSIISSSILDRLREGERRLYEANASCEMRSQ